MQIFQSLGNRKENRKWNGIKNYWLNEGEYMDKEIFIRLATKKEKNSNSLKRKVLNSFPELEDYEAVYKPYGSKGPGFYYIAYK